MGFASRLTSSCRSRRSRSRGFAPRWPPTAWCSGPSLLSGSLPSVGGYVVPAPGQRVRGPNLLAALTVLGAAPAPLAKHVERAFTGAEGLTVAMRNGLLVYFGDAGRPHAKWLSLARVLADSSSAGASYIDVRLPSHPAAGFPAGVKPPDAS